MKTVRPDNSDPIPLQTQPQHIGTIMIRFVGLLLAAAASGPPAARVAEGFCATRLDRESGWGAVFGAGETDVDTVSILDRVWTE